MFKKRRGINLPYNKQGLIYFTCMNFDSADIDTKNKILNLCTRIGKEHRCALFMLLTDDTKNIHSIAMNHHISETQLYHYRKKFYESWYL